MCVSEDQSHGHSSGLPLGSRLLTFGARIYDVPRQPHLGAEYGNFAIRSPRIDLDALDNVTPLLASSASDRVIESGVQFKSASWMGYGDVIVSPTTRFGVTYKNSDPNGDPMGNVLTDIPWVEDLSWRFVPPGGAKILGWTNR